MYRGYVKVYRKSLDKGWVRNHKLWVVWTYCLMKATYKETDIIVGLKEIKLYPGQFVFGRKVASDDLDIPETTIGRHIRFLEGVGNIKVVSNNKFSIITIINWGAYQDTENRNGQQVDNKNCIDLATNDKNVDNKKHKDINTITNPYGKIEGECGQQTDNKRTTNGHIQALKEVKNKDKKKYIKKKIFVPPEIKDVIQFFLTNGYTEESATKAFHYYSEGEPPWTDSRGQKVRGWKQKMRGVWFKSENKAGERPGVKIEPKTYAQAQDAERRGRAAWLKKEMTNDNNKDGGKGTNEAIPLLPINKIQ